MSDNPFFLLHSNLPRQGPGSDACTLEALRRLGPLPAAPRVMDLGCGPGCQTRVLARELGVPITAVDLHAPFLRGLEEAAAREGLGHLVQTRCADFGALDDPPGSVDLLWSEGAIYILGWAEGLRRWRPLLRPGGHLSVTEATWLTEDRPPEAVAFWREAYPPMGTVASNCAVAQAQGFEVLDTFPLPQATWWDEYYRPLQARMESLRPLARTDAGLAAVLEETEREIELCARFGSSYGYVFYLLRAR
jgi:serine/threonine-protein kinase HipA